MGQHWPTRGEPAGRSCCTAKTNSPTFGYPAPEDDAVCIEEQQPDAAVEHFARQHDCAADRTLRRTNAPAARDRRTKGCRRIFAFHPYLCDRCVALGGEGSSGEDATQHEREQCVM